MLDKMKLNNHGYLLVEIIVSFVIAMGVAYFLAEITIDLKNKQEDLDKETQYNFDKSLIIKEVMDDFENNDDNLYDCHVDSDGEGIIFTFSGDGGSRDMMLLFDKDTNEFNYGKIDGSGNYITNSLYRKKIDDSLIVDKDNIIYDIYRDGENYYAKIVVPATSPYSNKDFSINIIIPCSLYVDYSPS